MHPNAHAWVAAHAPVKARHVVDVGGRDVNGTVKDLFDADTYTVVDLHPGENVDVVGDFCDYKPDEPVDVVVCTEVFEHSERWRELVDHAFDILEDGGLLIVTCAGVGREPHSGVDTWGYTGGFYQNVSAVELDEALSSFSQVVIDVTGPDLRAKAVK